MKKYRIIQKITTYSEYMVESKNLLFFWEYRGSFKSLEQAESWIKDDKAWKEEEKKFTSKIIGYR